MDEYGPYQDAINDDTVWQHATCVLRLEDGSFHTDPDDSAYYLNDAAYIHANSAHVNVGPTKVRFHKTEHYIQLLVPGAKVGSVIVTGDETAAMKRLMFGARGGTDNVKIFASDPNGTIRLANATEYRNMAESGLNLWISWVWPRVRGTGGPPLQDQIDALTARVEALENP